MMLRSDTYRPKDCKKPGKIKRGRTIQELADILVLHKDGLVHKGGGQRELLEVISLDRIKIASKFHSQINEVAKTTNSGREEYQTR
jgi:hypothetical protein